VALEDIERVLGRQLEIVSHTRQAGPQLSPGLLESHYAPRTPLALIRGPRARERLIAEVNASVARGQRVGVLAVDEDAAHLSPAASIEVLGRWNCTEALARRLFQALRTLDSQNLEVLFARELGDSSVGLGRALADRLRRASRRVIDTRE
jgi:L-threonylcarbamoyladenylate synthase